MSLVCSVETPTAVDEGVRLRCPRCGSAIKGLICTACFFRVLMVNGIWQALPANRLAYYSQFSRDYEKIRRAEGRCSGQDSFYAALPYQDTTGRNKNQWKIRARSYDYLSTHLLPPVGHAEGKTILDLGAGNCWMSYRLALAGHHPFAVDLLISNDDGLGAGKHYSHHLPRMFPRFQAEFTRLPFEDGQFDAAIFNASLHYSEDYESSVREALRCVRSGGEVIVCDTPWYSDERSGKQMVAERQTNFKGRFGTASDSITSMEYLTDDRLRKMERSLRISWQICAPNYGWKWAMRPLIAKLRGKRTPSRFRIYVARKKS